MMGGFPLHHKQKIRGDIVPQNILLAFDDWEIIIREWFSWRFDLR